MAEPEALFKEQGLALLPIAAHHKISGGNVDKLMDRLDFVMMVRDQAPQALTDFLKEFNPQFLESTYSGAMVHDICEQLHNLVSAVARHCVKLNKFPEVTSLPEWQTVKTKVEAGIASLIGVREEQVLAETPEETSNKMHINKIS